jgi:hypothetical protein
MMEPVSAFVVAITSFGIGIFYVLSAIERPVWRLAFDVHSPQVDDSDTRFVHRSLKRLIPLLPPANGAVILLGTLAMLYQALLRAWDWPSLVVLVFYWAVIGYLITLGDIRGAVRNVQETSSDSEILIVRRGVGRLVLHHHMALLANLGVVVLQFVLVIGR